MRIHTNTITYRDLHAALATASAGGHGWVSFQDNLPTRHGSRTHADAWEVKLEGDGSHSRRRINAGTADRDRFGDALPYAATYDAWGWFLGHLFAIDPTMRCTYYRDAGDFHARTKCAYVELPTPAPSPVAV